MCRASDEGGRRCPGGHSSTRPAQAARQRLSRARRALAAAGNDPAAISAARERVAEAEEGVTVARILAGADQPDVPNHAGLRSAERQALSVYTGGESSAINRYVEAGYELPGFAAGDRDYARYMRSTAAALERAVGRSRLGEPTRAVRAVPAGAAEAAYGPAGSRAGQVITEHRFASATTNAAPPAGFGDVTVFYDLAPGTKALRVNDAGVPCKADENELLIGPHQDFVLASDEMLAGRRVIRLQSAVPAS